MTEAVNRLAIPLPPQFRRHADILHKPPQFIELLPIAIYACDGKGRVCWFNRRAVALWGQEPKIGEDVELFLGSLRLYRPNGQSIAQKDTPMSQVLKTGTAVHGVTRSSSAPTARASSPWSISIPFMTRRVS